MYRLELEPTRIADCSCCHHKMDIASGWVFKNDDAFAAYRGQLTGHGISPLATELLIVLGNWSKHSVTADRELFSILVSAQPDEFAVSVLSAEGTAWDGVLGTPLNRDLALRSTALPLALEIVDLVVSSDPRVLSYLNNVPQPGSR